MGHFGGSAGRAFRGLDALIAVGGFPLTLLLLGNFALLQGHGDDLQFWHTGGLPDVFNSGMGRACRNRGPANPEPPMQRGTRRPGDSHNHERSDSARIPGKDPDIRRNINSAPGKPVKYLPERPPSNPTRLLRS